jgi:two-component system, chemotaxis family, sensor kinase Cph1
MNPGGGSRPGDGVGEGADPTDALLPAGTPIDLDNCAREPIHIPGSVQPRGILAVVHAPDFEVRQVSANVEELLGRPVDAVLNRHLADLVGVEQAVRIEQAAAAFGDLRARNPLELTLEVGGDQRPFDVILHREPGGVLLVELELAYGERPFSFPNTYQAVRASVEALNRASSLDELYDATARAVRELTGFDRVMVYRYDEEYNGEVVAEAKRDDLNPFLGLHYPSTDIPAQARALYEKNWIRLIDDVGYTPSPLVPSLDPISNQPLDLTYSTLRSVSPIHCEYLRNMGVQASMSISLLRQGRLWGLIACHHYTGPHLPPYGVRAAAEFLGSTLSLRLVDRFEDDQLHRRLAVQGVLAKLTAATWDESESLTTAVLGAPDLLDLIGADGVAVNMQSSYQTRGAVPEFEVVQALAEWARSTGEDIHTSDCLASAAPSLELNPHLAAGALALTLPDGQFAIWFRREVLRSVDWGGDPHNKALAVNEGDGVRISPRKSFERWREVVELSSEPWSDVETDAAEHLRVHLVESLYRRARGELRVAETLQRSLLPDRLPALPDWELSAHYEPAAGGRIGGDWYDAFRLRDGKLVVLLGDVAGHGMAAAGTMAQLRNALRAHLFAGVDPATALEDLNRFCVHMLPGAFATVVVACVDLESGQVDAASAGHPMPFLLGRANQVSAAPIALSPPVGIAGVEYRRSTFTLEPGDGLVMFSDGLVERRGEALDAGLERLAEALAGASDTSASWIWSAMASRVTDDDVTIVTLRRPA